MKIRSRNGEQNKKGSTSTSAVLAVVALSAVLAFGFAVYLVWTIATQ